MQPNSGCSGCSGQGTTLYTFTTAGAFSRDYNAWQYKTDETLPDGTTHQFTYRNFANEIMLEVTKQFLDNTWTTLTLNYYRYDGQGRQILHAYPSAFHVYNGEYYSENSADLVGWSGNNATYLANDAGLIEITDYYTSSTATGTSVGGAEGYVKDTAVQQGDSGSPVYQSLVDYIANVVNSETFYFTADYWNFPTAPASLTSLPTDARKTTYTYSWYTGTNQLELEQVFAPVVTEANNGPATSSADLASANVTSTSFDIYGRPTWTQDAAGYLSYTAYDDATGAVTKSITDVNTASESTGLPANWTTPDGGGVHLVTEYQVDAQGREVETVDPNGAVTYTVYNDASHEVRTYAGWHRPPPGPT